MITQQKLKSSVIKAQRYRCFCGPWTPGRPGHSAGIMEEKVEALGIVISLLPVWTIASYKCPSLGQEDRQTRPSDLGLSWEEHTQVCFPACLHVSSPREQSLVLQGAGAAVPMASHLTWPPWQPTMVSAVRPSEKCCQSEVISKHLAVTVCLAEFSKRFLSMRESWGVPLFSSSRFKAPLCCTGLVSTARTIQPW